MPCAWERFSLYFVVFLEFVAGVGGEDAIVNRRYFITEVPRRSDFIIVTKGYGLLMNSGGFRLARGLLNVGAS